MANALVQEHKSFLQICFYSLRGAVFSFEDSMPLKETHILTYSLVTFHQVDAPGCLTPTSGPRAWPALLS